jgi:hypothetical protein
LTCWAGKEGQHPDALNPYASSVPSVPRRGIECTVAECADLLGRIMQRDPPPAPPDT